MPKGIYGNLSEYSFSDATLLLTPLIPGALELRSTSSLLIADQYCQTSRQVVTNDSIASQLSRRLLNLGLLLSNPIPRILQQVHRTLAQSASNLQRHHPLHRYHPPFLVRRHQQRLEAQTPTLLSEGRYLLLIIK